MSPSDNPAPGGSPRAPDGFTTVVKAPTAATVPTPPALAAATPSPTAAGPGVARTGRRSSRVGIGLQRPVTAEIDAYGTAQGPVAARMASLSPAGAFLEISADYAIGSFLHVGFRLPPRFTIISCSAVVRSRRGGCGVGVEFVELTPADRQQIERFVAGLLARRAPARS